MLQTMSENFSSNKKEKIQNERIPHIEKKEIIFLGDGNLGEGSYGQVWKGICRGKVVAIKILKTDKINYDQLKKFNEEIHIISTNLHPNICLFMGVCSEGDSHYIVQDYMPNGDMDKFLNTPENENKFSLVKRLSMAKDAALGLCWLHESNPMVIHRDLKPSNLLLDENWKVKVCDFGLSDVIKKDKKVVDRLASAKGSLLWMAPEVMKNERFDEKVDVYAFGIILWQITEFKRDPFPYYQEKGDRDAFTKAICDWNIRPKIEKCSSNQQLQNLISRCWDPEPKKRPNFTDDIITELDHLMLNVAINDKTGIDFWRNKFMGAISVPWNKFNTALQDFVKFTPSDIKIECLKTLLLRDGANVDIEDWGHLLERFGPIDPKNPGELLDFIEKTLSQKWFHGDIQSTAAENRLSGTSIGTFLIRFSKERGFFALSEVIRDQNRSKTNHIRIEKVIGSRKVKMNTNTGIRVFESLQNLADFILNDGPQATACEGSSYQTLFSEKKINYGLLRTSENSIVLTDST